MLISPAYAQAAGGGGGDPFITLLPIVLIFVVFYFLLIRPQQKKMKQHKAMVEAVRRGDRVVTGGGLIGTVSKVVSDTELQVELAENVRVRVLRHTIQEVKSKSEPAKGKKEEGGTPANDDSAPASAPKAGFGLGKLFGGGQKSK